MTWVWSSKRDAVVLALLVAGAAVTAMCVGGVPWRGSALLALDWSAGALTLAGPVAAGVVAWHYTRYRGLGLERVVAQTVRGPWPWLHPAVGAVAVVGGVLLANGLLCVTIAASETTAPDPRDLVIVVLAAAVLVSQVLIGAWIGSRFPGAGAAPIAAVTVFGLGALSSAGLIPETYRVGGATSSLVGQGYDLRTVLVQASVALAVAAVAAYGTLRVASPVRLRAPATAAVLVPVLALGLALSGPGAGDRYVFRQADLVCRGHGPTVCMAASTARPLRAVQDSLQEYAAPLVARGFAVPARWVQEIPGRSPEPGAGVLLLFSGEDTAASASATSVLRSLASPAPCPAFRAQVPPAGALDAQSLLAAWIAGVNGRSDPSGSAVRRQWLASAEAVAWAKDAYALLQSCDLEALRLPRILDR